MTKIALKKKLCIMVWVNDNRYYIVNILYLIQQKVGLN